MRRWYNRTPSKQEVETASLMMVTNLNFNPFSIFPSGNISLFREREITQFVWLCGAEARGESIIELQLVASVLMNRYNARRSYFGLDIRDIIFKSNCQGVFQFSCASQLDVNHEWHKKENKTVWVKVAKIVLPYYLGEKQTEDKRVLYYHDKTIKRPSLSDGLTVYQEFPRMVFYRENK